MLYVMEGSLSCEIAGTKTTCSAPALVFIGNYEPHVITVTSDRYVRYVLTLDPYKTNTELRPALLQSVFSFHPVGFVHTLNVAPIADEVRVLMEALYREWTLPTEKKLADGGALLLSALLYRVRQFSASHFAAKDLGAADLIVASVRMELECNFAMPLRLNVLADRHHISKYYLAHIFRKGTGYSMKQYLILCRISYACQQLSGSAQTIREIAEASGFHDMSNFSRSFKDTVGMSPSAFRKKTQNFGEK